jgi:hypothetical protein
MPKKNAVTRFVCAEITDQKIKNHTIISNYMPQKKSGKNNHEMSYTPSFPSWII